MSRRDFYVIIFYVLCPPKPFLRTWSALYLRGSGVAHIVIIFVVRIVGASIIDHLLVHIVDLSFLARSSE